MIDNERSTMIEDVCIFIGVVLLCFLGPSLGWVSGAESEQKRLEVKCLSTQTISYADAVAFCKEQVK